VSPSSLPCSSAIRSPAAATAQIELHQPDSMPAAVRIVWPTVPTITTPPAKRGTSTAMRLLAEASTMLARIKASKRL
jgi:hypothetical protein